MTNWKIYLLNYSYKQKTSKQQQKEKSPSCMWCILRKKYLRRR